MLDRLFEILHTGGSHRLADLARRLNTTPAMVEAMLENLARMGYVKSVDAACSDSCERCPMAGSCGAGSSGRVWVFAETLDKSDASSEGD